MVDDHTVQVDLTQPWAAFPSSFLDRPVGADDGTGDAEVVRPRSGASDRDRPLHVRVVAAGRDLRDPPQPDLLAARAAAPRQAHLQGDHRQHDADVRPQERATSDLVFTASAQFADRSGRAVRRVARLVDRARHRHDQHAPHGRPASPTRWPTSTPAWLWPTPPISKALAAQHRPRACRAPTRRSRPTSPWGMPQNQNGYPSFDREPRPSSRWRSTSARPASRRCASPSPGPGPASQHLTAGAAGAVEAGRDRHPGRWRSTRPRFITNVVAGALPGGHLQHLQLARPRPEPLLLVGRDRRTGRQGQHQLHAVHDAEDAGRSEGGSRDTRSTAARKAAYDDLVRQINAAAVNIWTYLDAVLAHRRVEGPRARRRQDRSLRQLPAEDLGGRPLGQLSGRSPAFVLNIPP